MVGAWHRWWLLQLTLAARPFLDHQAALEADGGSLQRSWQHGLARSRHMLQRLQQPQEPEEGVSELTNYMANFTKEMLGSDGWNCIQVLSQKKAATCSVVAGRVVLRAPWGRGIDNWISCECWTSVEAATNF